MTTIWHHPTHPPSPPLQCDDVEPQYIDVFEGKFQTQELNSLKWTFHEQENGSKHMILKAKLASVNFSYSVRHHLYEHSARSDISVSTQNIIRVVLIFICQFFFDTYSKKIPDDNKDVYLCSPFTKLHWKLLASFKAATGCISMPSSVHK